jgi:hypothetical protein
MTREEYRHRLVNRIATLLLTTPGYLGNYTQALTMADWIVTHAARVGWRVSVGEKS